MGKQSTGFRPARPETTPPLNEDEFRSAFNYAMLALTKKVPRPNPSDMTITLEEDDGAHTTYRFADKPWARAVMAIADRYKGASDKYYAVLNRMHALLDLLDTGSLDKLTRKAEGGRDIHEAVIDAAATVRLTRKGSFPKGEFVKEAERIVREKYAGEWVG